MRSSQFGGAGALVGDLKFMLGGKPFYTENGQEWLRLGSMVPYTPAYAALVARCPGMGVVALPARSGGNLNLGFLNCVMYYAMGQYVVTSGVHNSSPEAYCAPNLTSWSSMNLGNLMTGYRNSVQHGVRVVIAGTFNGSVPPLAYQNGTVFAQCGGGLALNSYGALASNGTVCVAAINQAATSGAGQIATSTDGINFTARVASGGTPSVIVGMHWSPVLNKFLTLCWNGVASLLKTSSDGYTFTDLSIPAGASFGNDWVYGYPWIASSPTVTLISLPDGRLMRITAGPTIDPLVELGTAGMNMPPTAQTRLLWDGTRFILMLAGGSAVNGGGSSMPLFASSVDGFIWMDSFAYEDLALPPAGQYSMPQIGCANSKQFLLFNGAGQGLYDITGLITTQPTKVGSMRYVLPAPQSNSLQQYGYIRIK